MFGNRRRKPQDEEDSLVPHGLIWHATAEPTPEEAAKSEESLGFTIDYAQDIERVRRALPDASTNPVPEAGSEVPADRPMVIPWWRVEQPEQPAEPPKSKLTPMPLSAYVPTPVEPNLDAPRPSRIQPMQIRSMPSASTPAAPLEIQSTAAQPVESQPINVRPISAPQTKPAEIPQASIPQIQGSLATSSEIRVSQIAQPVIEQPEVDQPRIVDRARTDESLLPKSSEITESFRLAFSRFWSVCRTAWLGLDLISARAKEQSLQRVRSLELGRQFTEVGKQGQHLLRAGLSRTGQYARRAGGALSSYSRTGIARMRQASSRVRAVSASTSTDVVRPATSKPATPSRIRFLIAASALRARIIAAQQLSAWRLRRERMAVDSRFWASMTMSAIAAIIALVIVSVVPHYAAKSLPSRILNTNPSVDASVTSGAAASAAQVKTTAPVRKPVATASSHPAPAKASSIKAAGNTASAKPRHVVNDDYVAPDTYKYYGTGSKGSR
ncbi:MAG TPA: hypothetical protein VHV29_05670 [Terriglobales bacterium]|nr:hypothetical protein [Terriglobales bacterium]